MVEGGLGGSNQTYEASDSPGVSLPDEMTTQLSASAPSSEQRTGISTISTILNHDNNTPATATAITQDSLQGLEDGSAQSLSIASTSKRTQKAGMTNALQLATSTLSSKQVQLGQTQDISDGYALEVALEYSNFEPADSHAGE